jgi:hypothetical protein
MKIRLTRPSLAGACAELGKNKIDAVKIKVQVYVYLCEQIFISHVTG